MAFFESMKETITSAGRDVSQKAKEVSGIAKLKMDIKSKEDALNKEYIALGKQYYENNKESADAVPGIANVSRLQQEIADLRKQVLDMQGACACPACGTTLPAGTAFCSHCGANLNSNGQ